jgi:hypothetical protein
MPERWSKVAAIAECIVLLAPMTVGAFWGALVLGFIGSSMLQPGMSALLLSILGLLLVALVVGWYLMVSFVVGGAPRLRSIPAVIWLLPAAAAIVLLIGFYIAHFKPSAITVTNGRIDMSHFIAVLGEGRTILVAIPLIHLFLERALRANNRMERPREP